MKVYIPSLNRSDTIKTHKLLDGFDWKVVVHDPLEMHKYKEAGIDRTRLICSYMPRSISMQRNYILDNFARPNEWICMMDDNISEFHAVIDEEYNEPSLEIKYPDKFIKNDSKFNHAVYRKTMSSFRLDEAIQELIDKCEETGARFAGFSANQNYFYSRGKKWKHYSLICSKFCIIKNDGTRYDERIRTIDDYAMSCKQIQMHGKTLVNNYIWPKSSHNQRGGIGRLSERGQLKVEDCKILMEQYPGLLRYKKRINSLDMAEVQLRGFTESFINNWRNSNGQQRTQDKGLHQRRACACNNAKDKGNQQPVCSSK